MENNKVGRPSKVTPEVVSKLEQEFAQGLTDEEACLVVGISRAALNRYCDANEEFRVKKELLKRTPGIKAKKIINKRLDEEDEYNARWYAERKLKDEFSTRNETTGADGAPLQPFQVIIEGVEPDNKGEE
jgi:hypothetical protein